MSAARLRRERRLRAEARLRLRLVKDGATLAAHRGGPASAPAQVNGPNILTQAVLEDQPVEPSETRLWEEVGVEAQIQAGTRPAHDGGTRPVPDGGDEIALAPAPGGETAPGPGPSPATGGDGGGMAPAPSLEDMRAAKEWYLAHQLPHLAEAVQANMDRLHPEAREAQ